MSHMCVLATVTGRVQGVGFRYHTAHEGLKLSLSGYAMNMDDGSVEVLICGKEEDVDSLLQWLATGPQTANVTGLKTEPVDWRAIDGFSIK